MSLCLLRHIQPCCPGAAAAPSDGVGWVPEKAPWVLVLMLLGVPLLQPVRVLMTAVCRDSCRSHAATGFWLRHALAGAMA